MPQSKNGKLYFTKEQYDFARYETSALEYAKAQGYALVEKGKYVCLQEHDSMVFTQNGAWFWNSMNMRGGALEFMMAYEGRTLVESVLILNGEDLTQQEVRRPAQIGDFSIKKEQKEIIHQFELPPKAENYKRLYGYLEGARGISRNVLSRLINEEKLYESAESFKEGQKEIHNCVFVTRDSTGEAVGAFKRGASTYSSFKIEVSGSSKEVPFSMPIDNKKASVLAIFEAAIDAASHATLYEMREEKTFSIHRIATGGSPRMDAIEHYLNMYPEIKEIWLCQDNDQGGQKQADAITDWLNQNYEHIKTLRVAPMETCKDWNEMLLTWRKVLKQSVQEQLRVRRKGGDYKIHFLSDDAEIKLSVDAENLEDLKMKAKRAIQSKELFALETPTSYKNAIRQISCESNKESGEKCEEHSGAVSQENEEIEP